MPLNKRRSMNTYIDNVTLREAISHIERLFSVFLGGRSGGCNSNSKNNAGEE